MITGRAPRVLYCTDTYPRQLNGVSVVTALSVCGLRERGWQVGVVSPRYPDEAMNPFAANACLRGEADFTAELPSAAFPPYPEIRLAAPAIRSVREAITAFRPDLVHCATEFMIGRMGRIAAQGVGVPYVTSYHTDFSRYTEAYGAPWLRGTVRRYLARFHRRAARSYTPSEPAARDLRESGVMDVEVWGRGVDTELFHPRRRSDALRHAYARGDGFMFLHVGRLAAEKHVGLVLDAFGLAQHMVPEGSIRLVVAGTGPELERLRERAPRNVTFLGVLDRVRDLPPLYASADAFVFSSLTETLGLVILEAMASGLPVVATPAGGVADHLRDGVNGLAFGAEDVPAMAGHMVRLVADAELRRTLARGARRTAEALGWEREMDRLDASYREILARPVAEATAAGRLALTG